MISSKKIDLIAILLVALVLTGTVCVMLLPRDALTGNTTGTLRYGDVHWVTLAEDDYYTTYAENGVSKITLNGDRVETKGNNVMIDGSNVTILGGGVYVLTGTLNNGSVIVDSADGAEVRLVLNGVSITSRDFSAIYIKQSGKTVISLVPNTKNTLTDGSVYNEEKLAEGKPDAALYSKDDLVINGGGSLLVNGNYGDGIKVNDGLKITEGNIGINASDEGINVNDYIAVLEAELKVTSGGTAIKCEHEDTDKGFIAFEKTTLALSSVGDGVNASSSVYMNGVVAEISSGDDAVHAEKNLVLEPERINITKCNEGLEGGYITINGGEISIISSNDGINAVGENATGGRGMMMGGGFGGAEKTSEEDIWLTVNGGHIKVETSGDGFDSNGSAVINGGFLEIYGPENGGNGSIDVGDGGYVLVMKGGSLLAAGSSGMAEHPAESSPQQSLTFYLEEAYRAPAAIKLTDSSGNEIISGSSGKSFNWVCISHEQLTEGETYTLYINEAEVASLTANGGSATSGNRGGFSNRGFR